MQCIKCGREISDGELFCEACASGPAKPKELEKAASAATPRAKKAVRRAASVAHQPRQGRQRNKLTGVVVTLCILLVAACSLIGYGLLSYRSVRAQFLLRETDLTLRENDLTKKEEALKEQQEELREARAEIEALQEQIAALKEQLSGAENTYYQNQSDQKLELLYLANENETLYDTVKDLESQITVLESQLAASSGKVTYLQAKSDFLDTYAVFVENDGTNYYHTYNCNKFQKQSFWIYSRKLAENYGFDPCPSCCGQSSE